MGKGEELDNYLANGPSKFETVILNEIKHIVKATDQHDYKLDELTNDIQTHRTLWKDNWNMLFTKITILETKTKIQSGLVAVIVAGLISIAFATISFRAPAIASEPVISNENVKSQFELAKRDINDYRATELWLEANYVMKQTVHRAYNNSDGSKSKFIKILMQSTGLTKEGLKALDIQAFLDTLVFRKK